MSRHQELHLIRAAQRVVRALPRTQAVAARFSDWIGHNDAGIDWEPFDRAEGRSVTRETWDQLRGLLDARARALAKARPDQEARAARMLGDMLGLDANEHEILLLLLRCNGHEGIGGLLRFLIDENGMSREEAVGLATGIGSPATRRALGPAGRLRRSGLVVSEQHASRREIGLGVSQRISRVLADGARTRQALLSALFPCAPMPETEWMRIPG